MWKRGTLKKRTNAQAKIRRQERIRARLRNPPIVMTAAQIREALGAADASEGRYVGHASAVTLEKR